MYGHQTSVIIITWETIKWQVLGLLADLLNQVLIADIPHQILWGQNPVIYDLTESPGNAKV